MEFKTLEVAGFIPAITHGMRNPLDSWDKSDSSIHCLTDEFVLGAEDKRLAQSLISAGPEHAKFMRQIQVWVDITAPIYWWSEFDTYKVGVSRNSCSTMHTLIKQVQSFDNNEEFQAWYKSRTAVPGSVPVATPKCVLELFELPNTVYNSAEDVQTYLGQTFIFMYELAQTANKQALIRELKQVLPSSWLQKATINMSYQAIRNMIQQRKNHRLPEWRNNFIAWARTLPYADDLLFYNISEEGDGD